MDYSFILVCLAAIVAPTLQFDDGSVLIKDARLGGLGRETAGGKIIGGLEIRGPLGGRIAGHISGAVGGRRGPFGARRRGHLQGSLGSRSPLTGISHRVDGNVDGGWRAGIGGAGADVSGRLTKTVGNSFGQVLRSNIEGNLRAGVETGLAAPVPLVAGPVVVGGGAGGFVNKCGFLPPSCRAVDPRERNTVCKYTFDVSLGGCVEVHVFHQCAARGHAINIFDSIAECNFLCH